MVAHDLPHQVQKDPKQACPRKTNEKGRPLLLDPGDPWGHGTRGVDSTDRRDGAGDYSICYQAPKALTLEASQRQNPVCLPEAFPALHYLCDRPPVVNAFC